MVKMSSKVLLAIAVTLSLITTVLVYNYLKKSGTGQPQDTVPVVVAKVNIGPKTKITPDMIEVMRMPAPYIQPGVVQDTKEVQGISTRDQILAGEQITTRRLAIEGKSTGLAGAIPQDKRALTVGVTEITGVAGFVKPGDFVDVVVTFDQNIVGDNVSHLVLQNLLVLAANRETEGVAAESQAAKDKKEVIKTATVTLAVSPDEATQLTLAEEKGRIRLALRPYLPNGGLVLASTVTPKDLVGMHSAPTAPASPPEPAPAPSPLPKSPTIQMIRGTKVEAVPIN